MAKRCTIADRLKEAEEELLRLQKLTAKQSQRVTTLYNKLLQSPWKQRFLTR